MNEPWYEIRPDGARIRIRAQPGAKKTAVAGVHGNALKLKVQAPPVEGKANEAIIAFLANQLGCRRSQVSFVSGETSRDKVVHVIGADLATICKLGMT